ncbi:hypothetical protein MKW98_023953 [Papaver atlanticum]|uniref:Uncharacterized protein n=1 Tax=Papaver atlanticum TaxID=357466 RepID=A0AAD4SZS4_9MAGN|nr:hypothetical protein MKW98_023953 [Papaver atlanticum]
MESSSVVSSVKGLRSGSWAEEEDLLLRNCINKYGEGKWHKVPDRAGLNRCRKSCRLRWFNYLQPNINGGEFQSDEVDLIIRMHNLLGNRQVYLWSLIAGRLPGRTANDIKNYYNTHLRKTCLSKYHTEMGKQVGMRKNSGHGSNVHGSRQNILKRRRPCSNIISAIDNIDDKHVMTSQVLKPQPRTFKKSQGNINKVQTRTGMNNIEITTTTTRFPNYSQVINKNITNILPLLVDDQVSNDQQIHDNSTNWVKNILFGETEEEDPMLKKKKTKKLQKNKKRVITSDNNASLQFQSNATQGGEEGMTKDKVDDTNSHQHAYHCNFDNNKGVEEGGTAGDNNNFWNSYLDDNLWHMLGEEQEQYLMM